MPQSKSCVDPTSLSIPSPSSEPESGPSRKRARTDISVDDRKEARAHRNRIAAQNSRDRRKAQFTYLERRVTELEEENRQLRAGMGLAHSPSSSRQAEEEKERERQRAQERENEELKERIRTLEKGWDAVMKALAAQGFSGAGVQSPTSALAPLAPQPEPSHQSTPSSEPIPSARSTPAPVSSIKAEPSPAPHTSFPLSPAPSHTSLDIENESTSSPTFLFPVVHSLPTPTSLPSAKAGLVLEHDSTRHLARMATSGGFASLSFPLGLDAIGSQIQRVPSSSGTNDESQSAVDDATMESLLREILAPSPCIEPQGLPPVDTPSESSPAPSSSASSSSQEMMDLTADEAITFDVRCCNGALDTSVIGVEQLEALGDTWVNDGDMQRMLESVLPAMSILPAGDGTIPELDLSWDLESFINTSGMVGVSAF
ncbi:hypothetical protein AX17_001992 [Amanita inopinata Kibby_2008]|nr:hypothetical protein AX17_001992 [Amanita inopinata Kibby_2008]